MTTYNERMTSRAERVMRLAQDHARKLNHEYLGTEHILLGLIDEPNGIAVWVMRQHCDLATMRAYLLSVTQPGDPLVTMGRLPLTPRTKAVVEAAATEADRRGDQYVNTEHLLLGILREDESVAAHVLKQHAITKERASKAVDVLLGEPIDTAHSMASSQTLVLLMRCQDAMIEIAKDRPADVSLAIEGTTQAIRWLSEYRLRIASREK